MRILLIAPASGRWRGLGRKWLFNGRTFRFSMLSLLSVAALTPKGHHLTLVDEQIDEVPPDEPFDLVGITNVAYWGRQYRFHVRGYNPARGGIRTRRASASPRWAAAARS